MPRSPSSQRSLGERTPSGSSLTNRLRRVLGSLNKDRVDSEKRSADSDTSMEEGEYTDTDASGAYDSGPEDGRDAFSVSSGSSATGDSRNVPQSSSTSSDTVSKLESKVPIEAVFDSEDGDDDLLVISEAEKSASDGSGDSGAKRSGKPNHNDRNAPTAESTSSSSKLAKEKAEAAEESTDEESSSSDESESDVDGNTDDSEVYTVERIVAERVHHGVKEFLIKWHGFSSAENTWEPQDNIFDPSVIKEWESERQKHFSGSKESSSKRKAPSPVPDGKKKKATLKPKPKASLQPQSSSSKSKSSQSSTGSNKSSPELSKTEKPSKKSTANAPKESVELPTKSVQPPTGSADASASSHSAEESKHIVTTAKHGSPTPVATPVPSAGSGSDTAGASTSRNSLSGQSLESGKKPAAANSIDNQKKKPATTTTAMPPTASKLKSSSASAKKRSREVADLVETADALPGLEGSPASKSLRPRQEVLKERRLKKIKERQNRPYAHALTMPATSETISSSSTAAAAGGVSGGLPQMPSSPGSMALLNAASMSLPRQSHGPKHTSMDVLDFLDDQKAPPSPNTARKRTREKKRHARDGKRSRAELQRPSQSWTAMETEAVTALMALPISLAKVSQAGEQQSSSDVAIVPVNDPFRKSLLSELSARKAQTMFSDSDMERDLAASSKAITKPASIHAGLEEAFRYCPSDVVQTVGRRGGLRTFRAGYDAAGKGT